MWQLYLKKIALKKFTRYNKNRKIKSFTRLKYLKFMYSDVKRFQERREQRTKAYFGHRYRPPKRRVVSWESVFNRICIKRYTIYTLKKLKKNSKKDIQKMTEESKLNILGSLRIALVKNILDKIKRGYNSKINFLTLTFPEEVKSNCLFEYKMKLLRYFTSVGTEYLYCVELDKKKNLHTHILLFQDMQNVFWKFKTKWSKMVGAPQGQGLHCSKVTCTPENIRILVKYMTKKTMNIKKIKDILAMESGKKRILLGGSKLFTNSLVEYKEYMKKKLLQNRNKREKEGGGR